MAAPFPQLLRDRLRAQLPSGAQLTFHYVRSSPAACDPIFAAAPNQAPAPTTCASHFLSASVRLAASSRSVQESASAGLVQAVAVEALVYSTAALTTLFVSKADSTGFLSLAGLPLGGRAVARAVACALLECLVAEHRSVDKKFVVSLFARAQAQYLFPGSVDNPGKHVLDDRRLIQWWCGILDRVLAAPIEPTHGTLPTDVEAAANIAFTPPAPPQAYLAIPGLDAHETRTYWPRTSATTWHAETPLRQLADNLNVPPGCLIPRFPDDPKARFAYDLDDELPENGPQPAVSPVKHPRGYWRSVRSLEQFWELMAFRQECSAGRVVGFLWGVFEPVADAELGTNEREKIDTSALDTENATQAAEKTTEKEPPANGEKESARKENTIMKPMEMAASTNGEIILGPKVSLPEAEVLAVNSETYTEITELLEQLDYAGADLATESTKRFISNAAIKAGVDPSWGVTITGESKLPMVVPKEASNTTNGAAPAVNMLGAGLIRKRKKRKIEEPEPEQKKARVEA